MGALAGPQAKQLSAALREAFLPERLDELLYYVLDRRRVDITMAGDYQARVFELIRAADAEGWLAHLVGAARDARPGNAALLAAATGLGLGSGGAELERLLREHVPDLDVSVWRARLGALEAQVCRVEIGPVLGTGFLVGPDLCMTNYHVVARLLAGHGSPDAVRLRFDYRRLADGSAVHPGTEFRLAPQWLAFAAPPGAAKDGGLPGEGDLDVAVLRLDQPAGELPIGRSDALPDSPRRGWLTVAAGGQLAGAGPGAGPDPAGPGGPAPAGPTPAGSAPGGLAQGGLAPGDPVDDGLVPDSPLLILQHPAGAPLKLAFGAVLSVNANRTRVRHSVNTAPGSSGAPCLTSGLELVALHHAGDPNFAPEHRPTYNAAVPISSIRRAAAELPLFPFG